MSFLNIKGKLLIEVRKPEGVVETYTSENLIVQGAASSYTSNAMPSYMQIGTGTQTPTVQDVTLTTYAGLLQRVSQTLTGTYLEVHSPGILKGEVTGRFEAAQGAFNGNYTEFGLALANSPTTPKLYSHGLFTDNQGQPTAITVSSEDQLVIYYTLEYLVDLNIDIPLSLTISGQPITGTLRYCYAGAPSTIYGWPMYYNPFYFFMFTGSFSYNLNLHGANCTYSVGSDRVLSGVPGSTVSLSAKSVTHSFVDGEVSHEVVYEASLTESVLNDISFISYRDHPSNPYKSFVIELDTPFNKTTNDKINATAVFKIGI